MYRHLLVALDNTDVSIEVVGNSVGLARAVGARITFFHAQADPAGASPGEPVRTIGRAAGALPGKTVELLAKAEAAARAVGVPCDSQHVVTDQLAAAILKAAWDRGCDLIVMATRAQRGEPGTASAPGMVDVAMKAGVPVLLSTSADPGPAAHAIDIIRDEHRSLAAALHAWMHMLASACDAGVAADPLSMRGVVRYVEAFTSTLHERIEEDHLFKRLRERTSAVNAELDELQRQHVRQRQHVADLAGRVATLAAASRQGAIRATVDLDDAVRSYASFVWEHLGREEGVILPAALRHLGEDDWSAIETALSRSRDLGTDSEADIDVKRLLAAIADKPRDGG